MTVPEPETSQTGRIDIQAVSFAFNKGANETTVFEDVNLKVDPGEFLSIIGPSGCGKTTLLNMVAGFIAPDSGTILEDGQPIVGPARSRGMVFQAYAVFPWLTVRQNIEFAYRLKNPVGTTRERDEIVPHYLELMGLGSFADAYPKTLSGGMKQRVAIARAYAARPRILLMDEPFAALDAQTRESMQELLQRTQLEEKTTVIFITHSVEEALFLSNRVVVLSGRPATITESLTLTAPLPRDRDDRLSSTFIEHRRRIEDMLHNR